MDFSDIKRTESVAHLDKVVHLVMYFAFCVIFWFESLKQSGGTIRWYMILYTTIFPIAFGGLMEYLQSAMTSYRTGDFMDFVYNVAGVLCATVFSIFVTSPVIKKFKERKEFKYLKCPYCKAQLRVKNQKGSHGVRCPKCRSEFKVKI
jgi:VanZ family protein